MANDPTTRDGMIDEMMALCAPDAEDTPLLRARLTGMSDHQLVSTYSGLKHLSESADALIQSGAVEPTADVAAHARSFVEQAAASRYSIVTGNRALVVDSQLLVAQDKQVAQDKPARSAKPR